LIDGNNVNVSQTIFVFPGEHEAAIDIAESAATATSTSTAVAATTSGVVATAAGTTAPPCDSGVNDNGKYICCSRRSNNNNEHCRGSGFFAVVVARYAKTATTATF
jgi:hypothetical protein